MSFSNIVGSPIFAEGNIRPLTTVKNLVIDPENGKLVALVTDVHRNRIVSYMDIISWGRVVKVHDGDSIIDGNDVIKVEKLQKEGFEMIGAKVETKKGEVLGKVYNYYMNTSIMNLQRICTAKGFLGLLRYETRVISAGDIIEMKRGKIIVKNNFGVVKVEANQQVALEDAAA